MCWSISDCVGPRIFLRIIYNQVCTMIISSYWYAYKQALLELIFETRIFAIPYSPKIIYLLTWDLNSCVMKCNTSTLTDDVMTLTKHALFNKTKVRWRVKLTHQYSKQSLPINNRWDIHTWETSGVVELKWLRCTGQTIQYTWSYFNSRTWKRYNGPI